MADTDEKKFNETLKRMLKTPPKPHDASKAEKKPVEKKKSQSQSGKSREAG